MSALEFIASAAWPLTILVIAVMFRSPITEALTSAAGRLKAGPFELEWKQAISTIEADLGKPPSISTGEIHGAAGKLDGLAEVAPAAAIAEAYGSIERALHSLLEDRNVDIPKELTDVQALANLAHQRGLITRQTSQAIEGLGILRNLATHGPAREISPQRAHEFVALTQGVLFAISSGT
jgi:hypothetical protein